MILKKFTHKNFIVDIRTLLSYRMGNLASIMEVNWFYERSFNVFSQSSENLARAMGS